MNVENTVPFVVMFIPGFELVMLEITMGSFSWRKLLLLFKYEFVKKAILAKNQGLLLGTA